MGGPGVFTIGENKDTGVGRTTAAAVRDVEDTGRFLSADDVDSAHNPDRQEANYHFEDGVMPRPSDSPVPYTDKAWSIAFAVNVCANVIGAVYFRGSVGHHAAGTRRRLAGEGVEGGWMTFVLMLVIMVLLAWGLSWGALHSLVSCPNAILQVGYLGFLGIWVLVTIALLKGNLMIAAAVSAFFCALLLGFYVKRQSRMRFGAANLKVAAMAVKAMPGTIRIALLMSVVQVVWSVVSLMAAAGSFAAFSTVVAPDGTTYSSIECLDRSDYTRTATGSVEYCECDSVKISDSPCDYGNGRWVLTFFWLASGTWGVAVLKNVVTATVTGSVASWWFSPADVGAVNGALYRATHGSFGSLCKAAAVITAVKVLMRPLRRIWLLRSILNRVSRMVGYGLSYAICFISIYGLSFNEALRRVTELFRQRGLTVIVNDAVVSIGLTLVVVCQTVLYFVLMMMMFVVFVDYSFSGLGFWALLFAMLFMYPITVIFWINIEVVRSSHKAVIVCFVQDPDALQANHGGQTYEDLSEAWRQMQLACPQLLSGGDHTNTHMQIECTEVTGNDVPYAEKIDSPGTAGVGDGGAARGVVQV